MNLRKSHLAAAVGAAFMVGGTAVHAQQPTVTSGQPLQIQLYGQVNRALMWADDGHRNKWFFADGEASGTRFGITGTSQVVPGLRAGARFEVEYQSNSTDSVNFESPTDNPGVAERWFDVWVEGAWGRVNLGQGSGAADDAAHNDLSGTGLADGLSTSDWGGKILWRTTAGGFAGGAIGNTHASQDFESRYDRVMYTTPVFGGFRAQVGTGQKSTAGEVNEASIWYSGKLAGDLAAAIGWSEEKTGAAGIDHNETIGGSISWLSTFGLSLTFSYTEQTFSVAPARDGTHAWGKVGYKFGQHAISASYGQTEDQFAIGEEGKVYGVGYVWNPIRWAEFYVSYHLFQLDRPGVDVEDIMVGGIGTRIRF
jgi:hypothetical protein